MNQQSQSLLHDMVKNMADAYNDSYSKLFPMGAIYVYSLKMKVYKGEFITVENNVIVGKNLTGGSKGATHEITGLFGTLAGNKLQIEVRNLSNNEVSTIEL